MEEVDFIYDWGAWEGGENCYGKNGGGKVMRVDERRERGYGIMGRSCGWDGEGNGIE